MNLFNILLCVWLVCLVVVCFAQEVILGFIVSGVILWGWGIYKIGA